MPLIAEEKLLLSLLPHSNVALTLRRFRHLYNEVDCVTIARLFALPTGENMTPIRLLHNAACGFAGAARAIGGALIGYLGIICITQLSLQNKYTLFCQHSINTVC